MEPRIENSFAYGDFHVAQECLLQLVLRLVGYGALSRAAIGLEDISETRVRDRSRTESNYLGIRATAPPAIRRERPDPATANHQIKIVWADRVAVPELLSPRRFPLPPPPLPPPTGYSLVGKARTEVTPDKRMVFIQSRSPLPSAKDWERLGYNGLVAALCWKDYAGPIQLGIDHSHEALVTLNRALVYPALADVRKRIGDLNEALAKKVYPPTTGPQCFGCFFRDQCPAGQQFYYAAKQGAEQWPQHLIQISNVMKLAGNHVAA